MLGFVPKAARPPLFNPLSLADADAMLAMQDGVSPELRRRLQRFDRLFRLHSDDAPGLMCIGGVIGLDMAEQRAMGAPSLSVTGNGETMAGALISCLGEAADLLSPFEQPGDIAAAGGAPVLLEGWLGEAAATAAEALPLSYTRGYDAADGRPVLLPADLCLRRAPEQRAITPPGPLSAGVAAGRSFAAAAERAMLELIERDAACLWWLGGRQAAGMAAGIEAAALLERLRQGVTGRARRDHMGLAQCGARQRAPRTFRQGPFRVRHGYSQCPRPLLRPAIGRNARAEIRPGGSPGRQGCEQARVPESTRPRRG